MTDSLRPPYAPANDRVARTLAIACTLMADLDDVAAVHVVPGRRPTASELAPLGRRAGGLRTSVDRDGCVSIRRIAPPASPRPTAHPPVWEAWLGAALDRFAAWNAGFPALTEGIR